MPWTIEENYSECQDSDQYAVVQDDGELMGCHASLEDAQEQLAALNINVDKQKQRRQAKAKKHESKCLSLEVKAFDYEGRTIEGIASVFGNIDLGGDIIHAGAFSKTLAERGNKVKLLWQHDYYEPIGKILEIREVEDGLYFKAIISDTTRGRDALELLRDGAIDGLSIGYDAMGKPDLENTDDGIIRHLKELRLWEISLVTFPMNEAAAVTSLKQDGATQTQESKAGRAISKANEARIIAAIENVRSAIDDLEDMLGIGEGQEDEDDEMSENAQDDKSGRDESDGAGPVEPPTLSDEEKQRFLLRSKLFNMED